MYASEKSCQFSAFGKLRFIEDPTLSPKTTNFTAKAAATTMRSGLTFSVPDFGASMSEPGTESRLPIDEAFAKSGI